MNNLGGFSIWFGLFFLGLSSLSYLFLLVNQDHFRARIFARLGFIGFTAGVTMAGISLMLSILNHEFFFSYVARYSSTDLPLLYLISSFWAGQEGSFLLWVFLGAWLGLILIYLCDHKEPHVMLVYNLNNLFLMILLIKQSPFLIAPFAPADGNGLNMLLQDPWMAIHPPIVFLGYAAYAIPFAYAVAAFWNKDYDSWIKPGLPWAIFAYVTLGAGIIIGGFWSYKVLGWGGYWGWDPVENASLLPWLAGMALVHGMILQNTKKRLHKTNFLLVSFAFILVIYCTFLTRSGILADFSVHSFTDLGITGLLVLFMGVFTVLSLLLLVIRAKDLSAPNASEIAYFSREFGLIAAIFLLCLSCLITGLGTSAPLITRMMAKASKVSTEFYVQTNLPLAVLILLLLAFVPMMRFGRNNPSQLIKKLPWAAVGAVVALAVTLWHGVSDSRSLLIAIPAGGATGMNLVLAISLMRKRFYLASGALIHLGVGLMFLGIMASSLYDRTLKERFYQGVATPAFKYAITLTDPRLFDHGKGERLELPLTVATKDTQFLATPDIYVEKKPDGQLQRFIHPFIKRGIVSDLYISPVDYDLGQEETPSNQIEIKKDQTIHFHQYNITFTGYDIQAGMGGNSSAGMSVGAKLSVAYKDEKPVILIPVLDITQRSNPKGRVKLPGPDEAFLNLTKINANDKSITLVYAGPDADAKATNATQKSKAAVILDVSIKPGMTLLWLGTILMALGGAVGIIRRR
jgi:cytochrome c-type biogenesis protein CcmF